MTPTPSPESQHSRRQFIKATGGVVAASALAGIALPHVHAAGSDMVQLAIVGCGGRGTGALANALGTSNLGPINLVAMADVFENKLNTSYSSIVKKYEPQVQVKDDAKHIGFDGYQHAMDRLKPGDVVILTTPLAFRWVHFKYAISKGLNVFMEKPLTADGPTSRRMLELAQQASDKGLKCGVGLMSRHAKHMQELHQRIQDGELGDLLLLRGYRMHGPVGSAFTRKQGVDASDPQSELLFQIRRFHSFIWASGGCFSDFYIHHIDHLCWMKNAWPVKAQALGGRHYREDFIDQNFDSYSVEYTFADGSKMYMDGRCINGCTPIYKSLVHGSKGVAVCAKSGDYQPPASTYKGQNPDDRSAQIWQSTDTSNPYDNEWADLMNAIRNNTPYNEVPRGVQASLTTSLGRIAAHTGVEWTYDDLLNSETELAPNVDKLTMDSPAFFHADKDGKYAVPMPGTCTKTEYPMPKA